MIELSIGTGAVVLVAVSRTQCCRSDKIVAFLSPYGTIVKAIGRKIPPAGNFLLLIINSGGHKYPSTELQDSVL